MKLIALSGGTGADAARSSCAANGILPAEHVLHAIGKKDSKRLAQELIVARPELILCFGETGLTAGLFVLSRLRKAQIPVFAVADAQTVLPKSAARFDAILAADHTVHARLLQFEGAEDSRQTAADDQHIGFGIPFQRSKFRQSFGFIPN